MMRAALARRAAVGVAAARRSIWGMSAQPTGDTLTLPMDIPCPAPLFDGATDTQVSAAPALATSPAPRRGACPLSALSTSPLSGSNPILPNKQRERR